MNAVIVLGLVATMFFETRGEDGRQYDANLNKLISPVFNCLKERDGVTCPPANKCHEDSGTQCTNGTKDCVKRSDPLTLFYLFTPHNKQNPEFLHKCGGSLPVNTLFNPELCTTVFIHGLFDGVCRTEAWRELKDQMLFRKDCNIILLDWSRENIPDIAVALRANKPVGLRLCCLILNIMKQTGASLDKFHFVGHSMGSHISGFAAKCLYQKTGQKPRRITALDPSNFGYYGYPCNERLCKSDAEMVDAIHVNIGDCFPFFIGYKDNIGHADFYPNGGSVQLSCYRFTVESLLKLDIFSATISMIPSFCSHIMAIQYYKSSINPCHCQFVGVKCRNYKEFKSGSCTTCNANGRNCAVMGLDWENYYTPSNDSHQQYFLDTTLSCPYCDNSKITLNGFPKTAEKKDPGLHCFKS